MFKYLLSVAFCAFLALSSADSANEMNVLIPDSAMIDQNEQNVLTDTKIADDHHENDDDGLVVVDDQNLDDKIFVVYDDSLEDAEALEDDTMEDDDSVEDDETMEDDSAEDDDTPEDDDSTEDDETAESLQIDDDDAAEDDMIEDDTVEDMNSAEGKMKVDEANTDDNVLSVDGYDPECMPRICPRIYLPICVTINGEEKTIPSPCNYSNIVRCTALKSQRRGKSMPVFSVLYGGMCGQTSDSFEPTADRKKRISIMEEKFN